MNDPLAANRSRLLGLAYRMLGSRAEAEDVLQDAYIRVARAGPVDNDEAFQVTVVTRLCLDRLKSARARREIYVGPWLPEPIPDADALSPQTTTELADDLSFALLLALERLSPQERAAFLLHDVFDAPFEEVARVLGRTEASVRQLAFRARRAVRDERKTHKAAPERHEALLAAFASAVAQGDLDGLKQVLRADAVALSDGGGVRTAALNPIIGADKVSRFFIGLMRKHIERASQMRFEPAEINGTLGLLLYIDGLLDQTLTIDIEEDRIAALYLVRNPDKLTALM